MMIPKSCTLHGDKNDDVGTQFASVTARCVVTPRNNGYIILNGFTCIKAIVNIYIRYR